MYIVNQGQPLMHSFLKKALKLVERLNQNYSKKTFPLRLGNTIKEKKKK